MKVDHRGMVMLALGALLLAAAWSGCERTQATPAAEIPRGVDLGTLVLPCDLDGKCRDGWGCFENRCIPPQLLGNPEQHREPLLFVFRAFEAVAAYGSTPEQDGRYHCPGAVAGRADTGLTPPEDVRCADAPEGRCIPDGSAAGGYPASLWTHPGWQAIELRTMLPHRFHYRYVGEEEDAPQGRCNFTVQAFGDLDGDGVYSTFERSGMFDHTGVNAAAGLYIDPLRESE